MDAPAGLGERGRRLWIESMAQWQLIPTHLVLLEEACRISDRLDLLDALIRGISARTDDGEGGSADISGFLAESRQQATALRGLVAEIRQGQKGAAASSSRPGEVVGGSGVTDLSKAIAARRAKAKG
ncbi:hypothetical protein [Streptomyces sp.]|uniref:hypothetical protein n=1 Tax=Streptomyces sp. TaxID=1931 RepID=UPI002F9386C9